MLFDRMSDEDVMCLHEFMDAGNGEAMYESAEGGMEGIHSADEYVALLKKSVGAGCYRAAEELACLYAQGERLRFDGNEFVVSADEEESCKYDRLAEVLKGRWEASNRGRILVGDFDGWMQIRCGEQEFLNSYLFPDIPSRLLSMCIDRLEKGILMSEWFSDENHGHDISEEIVDGTPRLFIRWKDDDKRDHCSEFPGYSPARFAAQMAADIESDYFGFSYFMTACEGGGLCRSVKELKQKVSRLKSLLNEEAPPHRSRGRPS